MKTSKLRRSTRNRRKNKSPAEESSQTSIDDLPEAILLHILSFLPTPDAIRISVVAPAWRNLWKSLPNLDFDMHYFQRQIPDKSNRLGRILFAEFVSQALRRVPYDSAIQKFKLLFYYKDCSHIRAYVDRWINMLANFMRTVEIDWNFVERGVPERRWDHDDDRGDDADYPDAPYEFHIYDIVGSSIEVLKFTNCRLSFPGKKQLMTLDSLKKVHLECFWGRAEQIELLMASCVNLDTFVLEYCGSASVLKIVSGSLRHLRFKSEGDNLISVKIRTPLLESIEIDQFSDGLAYNLNQVSSLNEATVSVTDFCRLSAWNWWDFACWANVISYFTGVERLTIHNIPQDAYDFGSRCPPLKYDSERRIQDLKGVKVFSEISTFHNLSYLTLKMGYLKEDILSLEVLLNKCPRLEIPVLVWDKFSHRHESRGSMTNQKKNEIADDLVALQIPRLRVVKMEGYLGTKNELYVLKKHGVVLEKIVAFPAKVEVGGKKISPPPLSSLIVLVTSECVCLDYQVCVLAVLYGYKPFLSLLCSDL